MLYHQTASSAPRSVPVSTCPLRVPAGRRNLLDIYRRRDAPQNAPVLIYFHGGHYTSGAKNREARPLLYRLASQGWVCISANYRLRPQTTFPGHQIDAKKVIAWVREHAPEYGADPSRLFVAGSSAGSNLASLCALTPNDPVHDGRLPGAFAVAALASGLGLLSYWLVAAVSTRARGGHPALGAHRRARGGLGPRARRLPDCADGFRRRGRGTSLKLMAWATAPILLLSVLYSWWPVRRGASKVARVAPPGGSA